jgi:hypothetical protein
MNISSHIFTSPSVFSVRKKADTGGEIGISLKHFTVIERNRGGVRTNYIKRGLCILCSLRDIIRVKQSKMVALACHVT